MQVIQQAFSHSSSSFMIGKIQGNIVDILYAPLSPGEVTTAVVLASATRSFMIAFISIIIFYFLVDIEIRNIYAVIFFHLNFIFYTWLYWRNSRFVGRKI